MPFPDCVFTMKDSRRKSITSPKERRLKNPFRNTRRMLAGHNELYNN